jgi:hypothetical protein
MKPLLALPTLVATKKPNISSGAAFFCDGGPLMKRFLLFVLLLAPGFADAQLHEYKAADLPRAGENIAQPCDYQASFPAGHRAVKAAWVTYDRGPDIGKNGVFSTAMPDSNISLRARFLVHIFAGKYDGGNCEL